MECNYLFLTVSKEHKTNKSKCAAQNQKRRENAKMKKNIEKSYFNEEVKRFAEEKKNARNS